MYIINEYGIIFQEVHILTLCSITMCDIQNLITKATAVTDNTNHVPTMECAHAVTIIVIQLFIYRNCMISSVDKRCTS